MRPLFFLGFLALGACEVQPEVDENGQADVPSWDAAQGARITRTYYVSNPSSGGCSSALWLQARGTGITAVTPSGCLLNGTNNTNSPSWDSLLSGGASTLSDTWYIRGSAFDKDNSSANSEAWCGTSARVVTVRVTGTTVSSLNYWFTDDRDCIF